MGRAEPGSEGAGRAKSADSDVPRQHDDSLDETLPSGEHPGPDSVTRAVLHAAAGTPTRFPVVPLAVPATLVADKADAHAAAPLEVAPGSSIGRYVVQEQLGSGTMGLVLAAIDPSLDRKVALKVVRPDQIGGSTGGRQRLVREAQAMARLAHPNVVTVYEVGTVSDHVFVAMEHIDGSTLDTWLKADKRSLREIVEAFIGAGRGLAAAHAASIVHRDFKPANVLISADGRVRVADFGLATTPVAQAEAAPREIVFPSSQTISITQTGALLGTPAYMSPEQHMARAADARADQFSFCVAMYEALYGELPFAGDGYLAYAHSVTEGKVREAPRGSRVPKRIRRVLLRGLATDPAHRYPSMRPLLADLDRAMSASRRNLALGGAGALGVGALAFALFGPARGDRDPCAAADQPAASLWDTATRGKVESALRTAGLADAAGVFARVDRAMDGRVSRIRAMRREACVATAVDHRESPVLFDRRLQCLDHRGDEVTAFVAVFGTGDREVSARALQAALALPPVDQCADRDVLMAAVAPPADAATRSKVDELDRMLAHAVTLESAGKMADASTEAQEVAARADKLTYAPLRARAHFTSARIFSALDQYERTAAELHTAAELAGTAKDDELLARIWILLYGTIGYNQSKPEEAKPLDQVAAAAVERAGKSEELRGNLENTRGAIALGAGDYPVASDHFLAAVKHLTTAYGADSPKIGDALNNAGMALQGVPRYAEAQEALERALDIRMKAYGPEHLAVAQSQKSLAALLDSMEKREESLARYQKALAILQKNLPPDAQTIANTMSDIGVVLDNMDRSPEALDYHLRAVGILEKRPKDNRVPLAYALSNLGVSYMESERYKDAFKVYQRSLAILEEVLGKEHPMTAHNLCTMGTAAHRSGDLVAAQGYCRRALAIMEKKLGPDHPDCAGPLTSLAEIAIDRGRSAEALPLIERVRRIVVKSGEPQDTASFGELLFLHGRALVGVKRRPEGLALMGRGLDLMKKHGSKRRVLREAEAHLAAAQKRR